MHPSMPPIYITYMNRFNVKALALDDDEILGAIENSSPPKDAAKPSSSRACTQPGMAHGHFNVLRGSLGGRWTRRASRSSGISSTTTCTACRRTRHARSVRSPQGVPRR